MFKKSVLAVFVSVMASGCAGVSINSLTHDQVKNAHADKKDKLDGYVVYQPMVVFPVENRLVCVEQGDGECEATETICAIGDMKTVPDYSKPYLVKAKSGFGKAGIDIKIEDGWRLGGIKDESDNTAVLSALTAMVPALEGAANGLCADPGLYKIDYTGGQAKPVLLE